MAEPETRSWSELPQDILALLLARLHLAAQIRFRAVCKHWRISNDLVKCPDYLPWGVRLDKYPSELKLFDPHSNNSYKATYSTEKFERYDVTLDDEIVLYASKGGWMLLGQGNWALFTHNPFINKIISLPVLQPNPRNIITFSFLAATLTDPKSHTAHRKSPECEIILFSKSSHRSTGMAHKIYIHRYCLSTDRVFRPQFLQNVPADANHGSTHYMNGQVYCFVTSYFPEEPTLICYNLADGRRKSLKVKLSPQITNTDLEGHQTRCWLTGNEGTLVLLLSNSIGRPQFALLSYDCSTNCWAESGKDDDAMFYVSGESILYAQTGANCIANYIGIGCWVMFIPRGSQTLYCFLSQNMREQYSTITKGCFFIDPPAFKSLVTNNFSC